MSKFKIIVAKRVDNKIVIEMPIDTLVYACETYPHQTLAVSDKNEFANYIIKNIVNFGGDSETGLSAFETLLDDLFLHMYQSALGPVYDPTENDDRWWEE